jgi:prepilin-type N-terminal cleavage/methylation domain-containing protein
MLAICRPERGPGGSRSAPRAGFTLLELLVVLSIAAGVAALIGPGLYTQALRAQERAERQRIADRVATLAFESFKTGRPRLLGPEAPLAENDPHLALTDGWRVDFLTPLQISPHGLCSGGRFRVSAPSGYLVSYVLEGPFCDEAVMVEE